VQDIGEILKSIANNFITDANSSDVMAVGYANIGLFVSVSTLFVQLQQNLNVCR
jgi:hypothetical protein